MSCHSQIWKNALIFGCFVLLIEMALDAEKTISNISEIQISIKTPDA